MISRKDRLTALYAYGNKLNAQHDSHVYDRRVFEYRQSEIARASFSEASESGSHVKENKSGADLSTKAP